MASINQVILVKWLECSQLSGEMGGNRAKNRTRKQYKNQKRKLRVSKSLYGDNLHSIRKGNV